MKYVVALLLAAAVAVVVTGKPTLGEQPVVDHYFGSPEPILPMTFAHADHVSESCVLCHHNYVDDTGSESCMSCHVQRDELLQVLEEQFHDLCRKCHTKKAAAGIDGGPPRRCIACHLAETEP
ncbi:MAG: cytochrome c family protein [Gammaproteobacteria bacterium]|nr:cytochrome c family protein [Gammaproteobacteria bacterium]